MYVSSTKPSFPSLPAHTVFLIKERKSLKMKLLNHIGAKQGPECVCLTPALSYECNHVLVLKKERRTFLR